MLFLNPKWRIIASPGVLVTPAAVWPASPLNVVSTKYMHLDVFIGGYAGNAIARVLVGGTAGTVDTGNNCAVSITEAATNTAQASIPGIPMGVSAITGPRWCTFDLFNVANIPKRFAGNISGQGSSSFTAANAPIVGMVAGFWLPTTASQTIQCVQIGSYTALSTTGAPAGNNMSAGTEWVLWGKDEV